MKVIVREFKTPAEADAFIEGIDYANDSSLQARVDPVKQNRVVIAAKPCNFSDEELLEFWKEPLSLAVHVQPWLTELDYGESSPEALMKLWQDRMVGQARYPGGPPWRGDEFCLEDFQAYRNGLLLLYGMKEDDSP